MIYIKDRIRILSSGQLKELLCLHRKHKDDIAIYVEDGYLSLFRDFLHKYPFILISKDEIKDGYELTSPNIELSFDSFLSFPSSIRKAIINDYDYLTEMVRQNINEHRFNHSLSVAKTARELAKIHGVDENKAYLAGLLHDCCKFPDSETNGVLEEYLKYYDPDKMNGIYGGYHSWVGPYYLKEKLKFHDKDILNAIYNHTILNSRDKLSMIVYIADKREPLRNIDDGIIDIARKDLHKAYVLLKKDVEDYIRSNDERFVENSI